VLEQPITYLEPFDQGVSRATVCDMHDVIDGQRRKGVGMVTIIEIVVSDKICKRQINEAILHGIDISVGI